MTDTDKCSNLLPHMMEVLQILKYSFRGLQFLEDLTLDHDAKVSVADLDPTVVDELASQGRIADLERLLVPSKEPKEIT